MNHSFPKTKHSALILVDGKETFLGNYSVPNHYFLLQGQVFNHEFSSFYPVNFLLSRTLVVEKQLDDRIGFGQLRLHIESIPAIFALLLHLVAILLIGEHSFTYKFPVYPL